MRVVSSQQLTSLLCGSHMDPEQSFGEEMTAFSAKILEVAPPNSFFLISDHENGSDPVVDTQDGGWESRELIPVTYRQDGDSYYGLNVSENSWDPHSAQVFSCYLGGSPLNSAPGFVVTTVLMGLPTS